MQIAEIVESIALDPYGYWIMPNGRIVPSAEMVHVRAAIAQLGYDDDVLDDDENGDTNFSIRQEGLEKGAIRILTNSRGEFDVDFRNPPRVALQSLLKIVPMFKGASAFVLNDERIESYLRLVREIREYIKHAPTAVSETRKYPGGQTPGSGKDFRQQAGTNKSGKQPGNLAGSGKHLKVKPGFVGEGKFSPKLIVYHGTAIDNLRDILKQGIIPNPKQRVWANDPNASLMQKNRTSLGGSYWTSNLMTAMSSSTTAGQRREGGGYPSRALVVIAEVSQGSGFADEDSLNLDSPWAFMMRDLGVVPDAIRVPAYIWYMHAPDNEYQENEFNKSRKIMADSWVKHLYEFFKAGPKQPVDREFALRVLETYLVRQLAYSPQGYYSPLKDVDEQFRPQLPTPQEADRALLAMQERLTRRFRASVKPEQGRSWHTFRLTDPVTYSGNNKIIALVEYWTRDYDVPMMLHYGHVPQDFLNQYQERVGGEFPGLIDRNNRWVVLPAKSKQEAQRAKGFALPAIQESVKEIPPQMKAAFNALAEQQRGHPETMFNRDHNPGVENGSGIWQWLLEHTGDLIHRAAQTDLSGWGMDAVYEKTMKIKRALFHAYGVERDVEGQIKNNYKYRVANGEYQGSFENFRKAVTVAGERYARAYEVLRPLTRIQWLGQQAAIAVGRMEWTIAQERIAALADIVQSDRFESEYFRPLS